MSSNSVEYKRAVPANTAGAGVGTGSVYVHCREVRQ